MTSSPTADVSVRIAWADDAAAIAAVQARAWGSAYDVDPEALATAWSESLRRPGDARNRVLVALERNRVVGYAVVSPADDPDCDPVADAELRELVVDAGERRRGHGSRLLQAVADTLRADRFTRAVTWTSATDDDLRGFLADAGWGADSAHRELDLDGTGATTVKQVRLHTAL
ncbi:GNAT family N-acetyltransferase [Nocardioides islandensis]|uniref:GNAT family N-acetyltransferase n=1 Tax=Nocardioides islandensis TaxID=433663 RepID=A0A930YGK3_9ACTN|nr:GNAT family N-acetyltransferase [Nocardioides islandensis]MBF4766018.1 GNAT family N-acetyltransferase [Nocardioides islandensis]